MTMTMTPKVGIVIFIYKDHVKTIKRRNLDRPCWASVSHACRADHRSERWIGELSSACRKQGWEQPEGAYQDP